jgi:poly-gamma-glutamate capsule biosynthesis protein CapA/YwtB (metallophosphatase superfamily)
MGPSAAGARLRERDPSMMPSIGLLGDVMLGRGVARRLNESVAPAVWSEALLAVTASLDLVIANLECCLSIGGQPTRRIARKTFFFRGPRSATAQLRQLNIRAVGLANNHTLDYEEWALGETLAVLDHAGIAVAGAGRGSAARCPAVVAAGGARVGLVAVADHPTEYAARDGHLGIAYADLRRELPAWLRESLADLRASCDAVIAFPHWGPNMVPEPQPWQHRRAAELQAAGAQLVAGHSAHVFHGVAWGASGPILTDLGDALDDYRVDTDLRNDLGLLAIWSPATAPAELELVGLRLQFAFTDLARGSDADWIAERLLHASAPLRIERVAEQRFRITP